MFIPKHFPEQSDWDLRETIEKSQAIKCPTLYTLLTNLKFFQYAINSPETWSHFNFSKEVFEANSKTFCEIKTMADFENSKQKLREHILKNGGYEAYVLKPQREGGANNYFGEDIDRVIGEFSLEELSSHILMKRIFPT